MNQLCIIIIQQLENHPVEPLSRVLFLSCIHLEGLNDFPIWQRQAHFRGTSSGSIQLKWCLREEIEEPWFTMLHLAGDFGGHSTWHPFFKAYSWLWRTIWYPKPWFCRHFCMGCNILVPFKRMGWHLTKQHFQTGMVYFVCEKSDVTLPSHAIL